jgi:hypothetical protein
MARGAGVSFNRALDAVLAGERGQALHYARGRAVHYSGSGDDPMYNPRDLPGGFDRREALEEDQPDDRSGQEMASLAMALSEKLDLPPLRCLEALLLAARRGLPEPQTRTDVSVLLDEIANRHIAEGVRYRRDQERITHYRRTGGRLGTSAAEQAEAIKTAARLGCDYDEALASVRAACR